jgi:hypothetical protein
LPPIKLRILPRQQNSTGLAEFQKLLGEMVKASNELPPKNPPER